MRERKMWKLPGMVSYPHHTQICRQFRVDSRSELFSDIYSHDFLALKTTWIGMQILQTFTKLEQSVSKTTNEDSSPKLIPTILGYWE